MIIALSGVSGVGKTTLGEKIADKLSIPFISGSAKVLWDKHDIKNHAHLIQKTMSDTNWGYSFQMELLDVRLNVIKENKEFVTDRSPIDNLVYFLAQLSPFITEEMTQQYILACQNVYQYINHQIYLEYSKAIELEDDQARITNRYYQNMMHALFEQVIYDKNYLNICKGCVISIPNYMKYTERLSHAIYKINEKTDSISVGRSSL